MNTFTFEAPILKHSSLNATFIEFPYDVEKEFGRKGQVKVIATFDGIEYRGSLVKMESNCHLIGITQELRKQLNKGPGDIVSVSIKEDKEPRVVEVPADLSELMDQNPVTRSVFDKLSYTHQKEYVRWITDAKKVETRNNRLQKAIELLLKGIKTPDQQK